MEHDNGITNFHFEIAADILNEEELELLEQMRPGLVQLEIGVQSTNPKTIKEIHRVMDFEKVSRIVRRIQERGNVHEHLDLIAGLPYEDVESFAHSFDDVYALKPEQLQLGFLKVLKGSFMQEHQKEYGIVHKAHPPYEVLYTKWISYEDVLRLKGVEEMVEVYYNSRQFTNTMEELEKEYDSAFDMYDRLAAYYEENDYNSVQHKRSARYEILLNYVRKYHKEKEDLFREVLTYDYYLRENAKSRPGFAGEYPVTKDAARAFYETEEETHEHTFQIMEKPAADAAGLETNTGNLNQLMKQNSAYAEDNSAATQELAAGMEETSANAAHIVENVGIMRESSDNIQRLAEDGEKNSGQIQERAGEMERIILSSATRQTRCMRS